MAISAKEFAFDPKTFTVRTDFTITLKNSGTILHDFRVEGADVMVEAAGKSATAEVRLEPGTYTFFCSIPGHRDAGIQGTLTVM